jgi:cobalt-zinc-cadmium efflux system protein
MTTAHPRDAHHHDHGHAHGHAQGHAHAPDTFGRAFAIGAALNVVFVIIETAYGIVSNSVALLADAGHNLSDVLALLIAWAASALARQPPTARYTYGLRGSTVLAALFNAIILLVAIGGIAWEAIRRLAAPEPVVGGTVIVVAAIGIAINGITALLFASGRKGDLNIRAAFLHMAADAAVSAGVVAAGFAILLAGWLWLDPAASLLIGAVIVWGTWGLLREAIAMSLGAVPGGIEPIEVQEFLGRLPGVARIHDFHVWPMSTTEVALTCHLVMPDGHPGDEFILQAAKNLHDRFGIGHATIQIEISADSFCVLEPDHVV